MDLERQACHKAVTPARLISDESRRGRHRSASAQRLWGFHTAETMVHPMCQKSRRYGEERQDEASGAVRQAFRRHALDCHIMLLHGCHTKGSM